MSASGRWRPSLATGARLAEELNQALAGRRIEKVWRPKVHIVSMKIQGSDRRLLLDGSPSHPHARLASAWPDNPHNPDRETLILRRFLSNARIIAVLLHNERALRFELVSRGESISLFVQLAGRFPNVSLFSEAGDELMRLVSGRPAHDPESPPLPPTESLDAGAAEAFLESFDRFMSKVVRETLMARELTELRREARAFHKRLKRGLTALEKEQARAAKAHEYRRHGELLKTVLHQAKRGMSEVKATDWSSGRSIEVVVPLDPLLGPKENLERLFKRYRKFSNAAEGIDERLLTHMKKEHAAKEILDEVTSPDLKASLLSKEQLADWMDRLELVGWRRPKDRQMKRTPRNDGSTLPYREFRSEDGTLIWLGRSAKHNDKLTLQHARGHDVWLHARDASGSHVILKCDRGSQPSSDALLDAAMLAAWHSKLRGESIIDVMWTPRKNVRKPKGAAAGSVTVSDSKTLSVRDDPARLRRLYSSETKG